ncbi:hypothetical protein XU18_2529 [Perkinsela sp. CCAP 1560/4]|nr:hypothetical protein XU18_2529 [Perkinsela sp. CCAP 1560/4]|eukprot:KNH06628.1 hypothetical protein XU18_2529 [Perkinsela sp. CCAP 1560/4]
MRRESPDESSQRVPDTASSLVGYCICTGLFSIVAGAVLLALAYMLRIQSITFAILCAKHEWDCNMKGMACLRAACAYFAISVLALFIGIVARMWGSAAARKKSQTEIVHITTQSDVTDDSLFSAIS